MNEIKHRFWRAGYEVIRVDTREQTLVIPGQDLLTADQVTLKISALATFRVIDALVRHRATSDASAALYADIQLALREVVAGESAESFLNQKTGHGSALMAIISARTATLGLRVDRVEIRDVMLPSLKHSRKCCPEPPATWFISSATTSPARRKSAAGRPGSTARERPAPSPPATPPWPTPRSRRPATPSSCRLKARIVIKDAAAADD